MQTLTRGIGNSLRNIMERRLSVDRLSSVGSTGGRAELPGSPHASSAHVDLSSLDDIPPSPRAVSNDASLVNPDDSVSVAGRSSARGSSRARHASLPEGARPLESLSACERHVTSPHEGGWTAHQPVRAGGQAAASRARAALWSHAGTVAPGSGAAPSSRPSPALHGRAL